MQRTAKMIGMSVLCLTLLLSLLWVPASAEGTDNLINNPGFEAVSANGKPVDWRIPSSYASMVSYDTGIFRGSGGTGRSARLAGPANTDMPYVTCDVAVEQLCEYEVSVYVQVGSVGYRGIGFELYFFDDAVKDNYDTCETMSLKNHRLDVENEWVQIRDMFTVPAGFVRARLMIRLKSGGEVWLDDASMRKTDEPAYLTLKPEKVFNYTEDGMGRATAVLNTVTYPEIAQTPVTFTIEGTGETATVTPTDGKTVFTYNVTALEKLKTAYTLTATVAGRSYSTMVYRYNRPTDLNRPIENRVYAYHTDAYLLEKYGELTTGNLTADFSALKESGIGILQVSAGNFREKLTAAKAAGVKLIVNLYNNMYPAGHQNNAASTTNFIKLVTQNTWGTGGKAIDFSDTIFAWAIMDEPFANDPGVYETLLDSYILIRSLDDQHPVWVMEDGNNYELSAKCCDIMGIDIYPGSQTGENIRPYYTDIAARLRRVEAESGGIVPVWPLYQAFYYRTWFPDITAMRSMIYQGFLGGGEAIGYYELDEAFENTSLMETGLWEGIVAWHNEEEGIALRHFTEDGATLTLGQKETDNYRAEYWQDDTYVYALFVNKTNKAVSASIENAGDALYIEKTFGGEAGFTDGDIVCTIPPGGAVLARLADSSDKLLLLKEGRWETAVSAGTWEVRGDFEKPHSVFVGLYKNGEMIYFWPLGQMTDMFLKDFTVPAGNYQGAALKCFAWQEGLVPAAVQAVGTK